MDWYGIIMELESIQLFEDTEKIRRYQFEFDWAFWYFDLFLNGVFTNYDIANQSLKD